MKRLYLFLLSLVIASAAFGQRTVSGTVTSGEDGEELPGAAILVKGTNIGTITDIDGKYVISVPEDKNILLISFIGMKNQEIVLDDGTSTINIVLESDYVELDKVVVTALGIRKDEKALGYSVQDVSGEEVANSGEVNIINGLSQKAAGVQVISSGGVPGASSKVLLRGNASFQRDNQPLIVVDGIPIDNSTETTIGRDYPFNAGLSGVNNSNRALDINPEDIESVTILKGPAAAALYGVRAGNGAIVYTTKKGKARKGKGINASYSYSIDISEVNKLPDLQSEWAQGTGGGQVDADGNFTQGTYDVADPGPDETFFTDDDVSLGTSASWGPKISSLDGISATDNLDQFFQTGISQNHNLSLAGGNEWASLRFSFGHNDQEGIVPNTNFKRTTFSINGTAALNDKLDLGASMSYVKSGGTKAQNGSNLSGIMLSLTRAPASFDLLGGPGENGYDYTNGNQYQYFFPYDNPFWSAENSPFTDNINRVYGNVNLNYRPLSWLTLDGRIGYDSYTDQREQIFAIGSWDPPTTGGEIRINAISNRQIYSDILATGQYDFTDKFGGSLSIGNNAWQRTFQDQFSRGRELNVPGFYNLINATDLYADETSEEIRTTAIFFVLDLEYDNMLYFNFTGRNEWSSTFSPENNSFFFPSTSLSFVFSEVLGESDWFSFGKVRVGYAQAGISPEPYTTATYFTSPFFTDGFTDGLSFPYLGVNGFGYSDVLGNSDLKPERVSGIEAGIDLRFWNGRLNLDVTYYNQKTTDILLQQPLASSSGFEAIEANSGEMVNRGWEIVASGDAIIAGDFIWNIGVNFSRNYNEVLALAEGVEELDIEAAFASIGSYAIVGDPYGVLYGERWARDGSGNLIIDPATGLPLVDPLRGNIGNPFPDWLMGIRTTFSWKGLSLTALLDIRQGGDVWCGTCARLNQLGRTAESADREQLYLIEGVQWDGGYDDDNNPTTNGQSNSTQVDAYNYYRSYVGDGPGSVSEQNVFDGSWVRLRELSLRYRFNISSDVPVLRGLEIWATGRNLWLSTDYPGVDPETSLTGAGSNVSGFDYFNMPNTRSYIFGVRANF